MTAVNPIVNVNFGQGINAAGATLPSLSLSAYRVRLESGTGLTQSRKNAANMGVRVVMTVTAVGTGGKAEEIGLQVDTFESLPEGSDFSDQTTQGRGNRGRVSTLKSLLVALGEDRGAINAASGAVSLDFSRYFGREFVIFYEPRVEGLKDNYPAFHFVDPQQAEDYLAGRLTPRLRNVAKAAPAGQAIPTGATITPQTLPAGLAPVAVGSAPVAAPMAGPAIGTLPTAGGAFGNLVG